ncbi:MAG: DUF4258 domain-containing protein [Vicinamibacterales bacterium]|nr:DUF4258 domain-containing protein [Vicinamibacterales bacterium]
MEDRPTPLDPARAFEVIQHLLDEEDTVSLSAHARERARERHFTVDDVLNVLRRGVVSANPGWDERFQNWKYRVVGPDCDNHPLVLIVAIQPEFARIVVITGTDTP